MYYHVDIVLQVWLMPNKFGSKGVIACMYVVSWDLRPAQDAAPVTVPARHGCNLLPQYLHYHNYGYVLRYQSL